MFLAKKFELKDVCQTDIALLQEVCGASYFCLRQAARKLDTPEPYKVQDEDVCDIVFLRHG